MEKFMNIGIDIDDTIANTIETGTPFLKDYIENDLKMEFKFDLLNSIDYYKLTQKFCMAKTFCKYC